MGSGSHVVIGICLIFFGFWVKNRVGNQGWWLAPVLGTFFILAGSGLIG